MPEIKIKGIPQDLINKIDCLTKQSDYSDRSAFLISVLNDYCLYHDDYFIHCLPDTVRILAEDVIKRNSKNADRQLQYTLAVNAESQRIMKLLLDVLNGESSGQ